MDSSHTSDGERTVFISYSSKDSKAAEVLLNGLERAGLPCWIASRDIEPGRIWPGKIADAIQNSRTMVLIVSKSFNISEHTRRELMIAVEEGLLIIPVLIEEFKPWGHMRYFLIDLQWIEAPSEVLQDKIDTIAATIRTYINHPESCDGMVSAVDLGIHPLPLKEKFKLVIQRPVTIANRQPSQLLQAHNAFIELYGREKELNGLKDFINQDGRFRWRVYYGPGGIGKTRLGNEFAKHSLTEGWYAGFLDGTTLQNFAGWDGLSTWKPFAPTLIIVDYAASKIRNLGKLFSRCAALEMEESGPGEFPVRIILLERHAVESQGWLDELLGSGEGVVHDLLQNVCFDGVKQLKAPGAEEGSEHSARSIAEKIVLASFKSWEKATGGFAPALPVFDEKDWGKIKERIGYRPLYLQMAAINACEKGSAEGLPGWGRSDLLEAAVKRERDYVRSECKGEELRVMLEHIVAILCIAGIGTAKNKSSWLDFVANEIDNLNCRSVTPREVEKNRKTIFIETYLGNEDTGISLIQPDIISEGFAATVLREEEDPPTRSLRVAIKLAGKRAWSNLVRMVQDLHGLKEFEHIDRWLFPLIDGSKTEELQEIALELPEHTVSLHEFGVLVNEYLVDKIPDHDKLSKARHLLALAIHRSRTSNVNSKVKLRIIEELQETISILEITKEDDEWLRSRSLIKAFRHLGFKLHELKRDDEGLEYILKAVDLGDQLHAQKIPEAKPEVILELANALNEVSIFYRDIMRYEESRESAERAVELGKSLRAQNPTLYGPDLARYLNNLGQTLISQGKHLEAWKYLHNSAEIRLDFTRENPDEYSQPLLKTVWNIESLRFPPERTWEALESWTLLIEVYSELSMRHPDSYRAKIAGCLDNAVRLAVYIHNEATSFYNSGECKKAIEMMVKVVRIFRGAINSIREEAETIGAAIARCNLSSVLCWLGDWCSQSEQLGESIEQAHKALEILTPENSHFNWAATLTNLGHALSRKGELEGRREMVEEGAAILEQALSHFVEMENEQAISEAQTLLSRANEILKQLPNDDLKGELSSNQ